MGPLVKADNVFERDTCRDGLAAKLLDIDESGLPLGHHVGGHPGGIAVEEDLHTTAPSKATQRTEQSSLSHPKRASRQSASLCGSSRNRQQVSSISTCRRPSLQRTSTSAGSNANVRGRIARIPAPTMPAAPSKRRVRGAEYPALNVADPRNGQCHRGKVDLHEGGRHAPCAHDRPIGPLHPFGQAEAGRSSTAAMKDSAASRAEVPCPRPSATAMSVESFSRHQATTSPQAVSPGNERRDEAIFIYGSGCRRCGFPRRDASSPRRCRRGALSRATRIPGPRGSSSHPAWPERDRVCRGRRPLR